MMSGPIIYVDHSTIRDGKFEGLKSAMNDLVAFIKRNEPRLVAYNVYFSEDRKQMTVIHVHADAASLDHHMEVIGQELPKFSNFIRMLAIDIYGSPGDNVLQLLKGKAEMLGSGTIRVHNNHDGFAHFSRA